MATRTTSKRTRPLTQRALVTGGAGFIGSHLTEALLEEGYAVTALDNLTTGRLENLEQLEAHDDFELVGGDVADETLVDDLLREHDVVFHLAAAVGVKLILADPIESFRTNVLGTESVLRGAARHGTKVLIASTSEVYGKTVATPQSEGDDVLLGPSCFSRWSYAACKMLDEFLGLAYAREGLPVVCFRLFNTVGPRQTGHYGMVVPRLVDAALRGEALPVHGDGSQSRCFLHVSDAVQAILRLNRSQRAMGQVFNIGSTESVTIADLARRVIAAVGMDGHEDDLIRFMPYEEAYPGGGFEDIRCRQPDTSKIRSLTRWRPTRTLDDILHDVVAERLPAFAPVALEPSVELVA
jgi:UDP-glucose 4-epimerase